MSLRIAKTAKVLLMRPGNMADYLVGGELVWGAYDPPLSTPTGIIDGGANIGMFSLIACAHFPGCPIVCFEPDRENVDQLRKNLEVNRIQAEIVHKALWSKETTLYYRSHSSYSGFVSEQPPGIPIECTVPVVQKGCWLKLDIEGAEYEVLPQILMRGIRPACISMEIHANQTKGHFLLGLLKDSGYRLRRPYDPSPDCLNIEADYQG